MNRRLIHIHGGSRILIHGHSAHALEIEAQQRGVSLQCSPASQPVHTSGLTSAHHQPQHSPMIQHINHDHLLLDPRSPFPYMRTHTWTNARLLNPVQTCRLSPESPIQHTQTLKLFKPIQTIKRNVTRNQLLFTETLKGVPESPQMFVCSESPCEGRLKNELMSPSPSLWCCTGFLV